MKIFNFEILPSNHIIRPAKHILKIEKTDLSNETRYNIEGSLERKGESSNSYLDTVMRNLQYYIQSESKKSYVILLDYNINGVKCRILKKNVHRYTGR